MDEATPTPPEPRRQFVAEDIPALQTDFAKALRLVQLRRQYPFLRQGNWDVEHVELPAVLGLFPYHHKIANHLGEEEDHLQVDLITWKQDYPGVFDFQYVACDKRYAAEEMEMKPQGQSVLERAVQVGLTKVKFIVVYRWGYKRWDDGDVGIWQWASITEASALQSLVTPLLSTDQTTSTTKQGVPVP